MFVDCTRIENQQMFIEAANVVKQITTIDAKLLESPDFEVDLAKSTFVDLCHNFGWLYKPCVIFFDF